MVVTKEKKCYVTRRNNTYAFCTQPKSCNERAWQVKSRVAIERTSDFVEYRYRTEATVMPCGSNNGCQAQRNSVYHN